MTSPTEQSLSVKVEDEVENSDLRPLKCAIQSMTRMSYRQLQYMAKSCGVPSNLKKEVLKMAIKAKASGDDEELEALLKQVKETRLLKKKQRVLKSKCMTVSEYAAENNNEAKPKDCQETVKPTCVRNLLHNMIEMRAARNVTIRQTSTQTRYKALVTPGTWKFNNCTGVTPSTITTQQKPETINPNPCKGPMVKFSRQSTLPVVNNQAGFKASHSSNLVHLSKCTGIALNTATTQQKPETISRNPCEGPMVKFSRQSTLPVVNNQADYKASHSSNLVHLSKCTGITSNTAIKQQKPETISRNPCEDNTISLMTPPVLPIGKNQDISSYVNINHVNNPATASVPVVANQSNNYLFGCCNINSDQSRMPRTAVSVRETLLQQYYRNPVCNESAQKITGNNSWSGGMRCHQSKVASYQPLQNYYNLPHNNNQYCNKNNTYSSIQSYNNQPRNNFSQTSEIACCQSRQFDTYKASQQYERSFFGGFQQGIQRSSTPVRLDEYYDETRAAINTKISSTRAETGVGPQSTHTTYNRVCLGNVPLFGVAPSEVSPGVIDVTNLSAEDERNSLDTDLGLLANMAITKAQEVMDDRRGQQYNKGLLMVDGGNSNCPIVKDDTIAHGPKPIMQDIPTWNSFLEQMSSNLSPGVTNKELVMQCKYGCHTPMLTRQQQLEHEEHCLHQPIRCPMISCTYVGQLGSITTHILNLHKCDVLSSGNGSFFMDFTGTNCSFEHARCPSLRSCPKRFCFPQLVNGRLFLIEVIGNFQSMQVIVYIQYVNDHFNWKSHVVCEVVRPDGVPYQWTGEVTRLTHNSMHIITRRKCLIFNMNTDDSSQNLFVLHNKIYNQKTENK